MYCVHCKASFMSSYKHCPFCGTKLKEEDNKNEIPSKEILIRDTRKNPDFRDIFYKIEKTIKQECCFTEEEFEEHWGQFRNFHYNNYSDKEVYWKMVQVVFYSGMKAATVTSKLPFIRKHLGNYKIVKEYTNDDIRNILNNSNIICNTGKIEACVKNATIYDGIIKRYGSFKNYIEHFGNLSDDQTLETLKSDLTQFEYLGPITAYHLMLDMGLNVWKPDRVIRRILFRLRLIDSEDNIEQSISVGKAFARHIREPIR